MKIESTAFNTEHYGSKIISTRNHGDYMLHCVDICNEIKINGKTFTAIYQTASSFLGNDYNAPSDKLELSREADTCGLLLDADGIESDDIEHEFDGEQREYHRNSNGFSELTINDVLEIKAALSDNFLAAKEAMKDLELSDDTDNWSYDDEFDFDQLGYAIAV